MKWLFLFSFSFFLSCPGLIQAPPATHGSGIPIGTPTTTTPTTPTDVPKKNKPDTDSMTLLSEYEWGVVKCATNEIKDIEVFNEALRELLSTSLDPASPKWQDKWVKCNLAYDDWKGNFLIRGNVTFENRKKFQPKNQTQNLTPTESSYIELHIISHHNKPLTEYPIKLEIGKYTDSSINGNNINLTFKDDKGEVNLVGTVDKNERENVLTISGSMSFNNYVRFNGSTPGSRGSLGLFEIRVCSFLDCVQASPTTGL